MRLQFFGCILFIVFTCSCSDSQQKNTPVQTGTKSKSLPKNKPGSTYQDTLIISSAAAIFYSPDSLQLEKIKAVSDKDVFEANMHEYYFLTTTAHKVIRNNMPSLKIIDAKNIRYLLFIKDNKNKTCIDLDSKFDPYGLILFKPGSDPEQADLSNTDTALGFYFTGK